MGEKIFKSITEQVELLKSKGLTFIDEADGAKKLSDFGYYEIINGYKGTFLDGKNNYKEGTKFDDIFALYYFDSKVRSITMIGLEYAESFLKQKLAYTLAEIYGINFEDYMNEKNFIMGKNLKFANPSKNLFTDRDLFIHEMKKIRDDRSHPIKHYRENHGNVPPWILIKKMSFGNLRYAISLLKQKDKNVLMRRIYMSEVYEDLSDKELLVLFSDTIKMIHEYRNRAAHGSRLYNFFPNFGFSYNKLLHDSVNISKTAIKKNKLKSSGLHLLFASLSLWSNYYPYTSFKQELGKAFKGYSTKWEEQIPLVLKEMQLTQTFYDSIKLQ